MINYIKTSSIFENFEHWYVILYLGCQSFDNVRGFQKGYTGYWNKGYHYKGRKSKTECAESCLSDCYAITIDDTAVTYKKTECYHYYNQSILKSARQILDRGHKSFMKCPGIFSLSSNKEYAYE